MYAVGGDSSSGSAQDVSQDRNVSQDRSRANGFADAFDDALHMMQQLSPTLGDIEARMRHLAAAVDVLTEKIDRAGGTAAPAAAPALAPRHRFVFKVGPQHPPSDMFAQLQQAEGSEYGNSELVFLDDKFFWQSWKAGTQYITKIKVLGSYGGSFYKVSLALRDEKNGINDVTEEGYMTPSQYKKLCIFVVSRSLRDDLLDPGIGLK